MALLHHHMSVVGAQPKNPGLVVLVVSVVLNPVVKSAHRPSCPLPRAATGLSPPDNRDRTNVPPAGDVYHNNESDIFRTNHR